MKCVFMILVLIVIGTAVLSADSNNQFMAADQSVFVMPTAYTMPQGSHSFTDYYVVFLQYAYAATATTHLSAAMIFPISTELLRTFTLGAKQNYYAGKHFQSALWGNLYLDEQMGTIGNVISYGNEKNSAHLAAAWVVDSKKINPDFAIMLGGITNTSERISLMAEIISTSEIVDEQSNGLITVGMRFKGKGQSWDLGVIRLLRDHPSEILGIPFLKATFIF